MQLLIVVDMQDDFLQGVYQRDRVTHWVTQEIEWVRSAGGAVIVLEFDTHGSTTLPILACLRDTTHHFGLKLQDDGSEEVAHLVAVNHYHPTSFRVVGVNTDACVYATVKGLRNRFLTTPITVAANGCSSANRSNWLLKGRKYRHRVGLEIIEGVPNVEIDTFVVPKRAWWHWLSLG
jgi:nicotinamidase-related amidase